MVSFLGVFVLSSSFLFRHVCEKAFSCFFSPFPIFNRDFVTFLTLPNLVPLRTGPFVFFSFYFTFL